MELDKFPTLLCPLPCRRKLECKNGFTDASVSVFVSFVVAGMFCRAWKNSQFCDILFAEYRDHC